MAVVLVVSSLGETSLLEVLACLLLGASVWEAQGYAQQLDSGLLLWLVCVWLAGQLWLGLVESRAFHT